MAQPVEINTENFRKIVLHLYNDLEKINASVSHLDKGHDMSVYPPGVRLKC